MSCSLLEEKENLELKKDGRERQWGRRRGRGRGGRRRGRGRGRERRRREGRLWKEMELTKIKRFYFTM